MKRKLYLECYSGISGDMTVAALAGLLEDRKPLFEVLDHMPVSGFSYELKQVKKSGVDAWDFLVKLDEAHENHDHDMEYLHGHEHHHEHTAHEMQEHVHETSISHGHGPEEHSHHDVMHEGHSHGESEHHHTHGEHHHRGLPEIFSIIDQCPMSAHAKELAKKIFHVVGRAEAKAHQVPINEVHFHEVGAIDSIVDIVAAAVCMDLLQVDDVIVPYLCEGQGTVRCQHGILPIPVPAVTNIIEENHLPLRITSVKGELVTPTGAAFAAAVRTQEQLPETFTVERVGIGAGKRNYECPGILRAMLIREETEMKDTICKLEANMDDCTGEQLGYVLGILMEAGARDVHYTPVYMKKNRPGWQLNVICTPENQEKMEEIIFRETTTIGIRRQLMERTVLEREQKKVETPYGTAEVKICKKGDLYRIYPEYEAVAKLSKEHDVAFWEVYESVKREAE